MASVPPAVAPALAAFRQLPPARRAALVAVVAGTALLLVGVARWASTPEMALLFGSLAPADAGRIVEQLDAERVAYELREGGTAVFVPQEEVYGLRLRLAAAGAVSDGPAGYELFDTGTLGMTDFMQRLNVKRALEGELARTITSVRAVRSARVHLVLPERSAFREQQTPPSASVVLAVQGSLTPEQVAGIAALVAGAVEGLGPEGVTVLDEAGRMLAGPEAGGAAGLTSAQLRMRQEVEEHLARAGQTMLDQMLGPGRAVVRVSAELDLARTETETNSLDPESQTLISEERSEETGEAGGSQSTVRNFELSRETRREAREAGQIRTLTVSVVLDEAAAAAAAPADADAEPAPFTDDQLRQVEALVKNAVGFDAERGDRFAVQQIRFAEGAGAVSAAEAAAQRTDLISLAVRSLLVLLALFLGYRLLRSLSARIAAPAPEAPAERPAPRIDVALTAAAGPSGDGQAVGLPELADAPRMVIAEAPGDVLAAKLAPEAQARLADAPGLVGEVAAHVAADPAAAARLVRAWLEEDAV